MTIESNLVIKKLCPSCSNQLCLVQQGIVEFESIFWFCCRECGWESTKGNSMEKAYDLLHEDLYEFMAEEEDEDETNSDF